MVKRKTNPVFDYQSSLMQRYLLKMDKVLKELLVNITGSDLYAGLDIKGKKYLLMSNIGVSRNNPLKFYSPERSEDIDAFKLYTKRMDNLNTDMEKLRILLGTISYKLGVSNPSYSIEHVLEHIEDTSKHQILINNGVCEESLKEAYELICITVAFTHL